MSPLPQTETCQEQIKKLHDRGYPLFAVEDSYFCLFPAVVIIYVTKGGENQQNQRQYF